MRKLPETLSGDWVLSTSWFCLSRMLWDSEQVLNRRLNVYGLLAGERIEFSANRSAFYPVKFVVSAISASVQFVCRLFSLFCSIWYDIGRCGTPSESQWYDFKPGHHNDFPPPLRTQSRARSIRVLTRVRLSSAR